ncbi:MAG: hypothetical protein ABJC24_07680 [Chloroflexota bacterium]
MRLADWPRNPYLNDEVREWVRAHLESLAVEDVAVYALASAGQDDERRVLVATEAGLLDSWYAPHGSTARFSLSVRLYPWQSVRGVDLRGETFRLWAHEHQSRWRLRLGRPALDTMADTPELGRALAEFAAACAVMAEPAAPEQPLAPEMEDAVPAFLGRAAAAEGARSPIRVDTQPVKPRPAARAVAAPAAAPDDAADAVASQVVAPQSAGPSRAAPSTTEHTVADLERRLGLRGPD